ncbi:hypothetical protein BDR26DRAFT_920296 [Obelidium mucronatum]|nr:hypothetical protein BDR26DRAFT_920296 [Obelidium mucronatum]
MKSTPTLSAASNIPPPPTYSTDAINNDDLRLEAFRSLCARHEISNLMAMKLRRLEAYDIVIIADDSGSMSTKSTNGLTAADPFAKTATRWDELKQTVAMVSDVATTLDEDGIDVFFLNRPPIRNITGPSVDLDKAFMVPPRGYTPIARVLRQVLAEKWHCQPVGERKKLLVLIATDGQPTDDQGNIDKHGLKRALEQERGRPGDIPVAFLVCTDDDHEIEYLNEWDNSIRDLDVVDDYYTERRQILSVQGNSFPFSRGDWVCKMLLGAVDPEIDALDEYPVYANSGAARRTSTFAKRQSTSDANGGMQYTMIA